MPWEVATCLGTSAEKLSVSHISALLCPHTREVFTHVVSRVCVL